MDEPVRIREQSAERRVPKTSSSTMMKRERRRGLIRERESPMLERESASDGDLDESSEDTSQRSLFRLVAIEDRFAKRGMMMFRGKGV